MSITPFAEEFTRSVTPFDRGIPKHDTVILASATRTHTQSITLTLERENAIVILAPPAHTHTQSIILALSSSYSHSEKLSNWVCHI